MEDTFSKQYRKYYQNIEPTLVKPKNKLYTTVIFFLLVVSLFAWYAIKPTIQTIIFLQREIADKSKVNAQMDEKINALIQAQSTYESLAEKIPFVAQALPDDPSVLALIDQIKLIGSEVGASVSGIQIAKSPLTQEKKEEPLTNKVASKLTPIELPITLTISGSFPKIHAFIKALGAMRRLYRFDSITIAQNSEAPSIAAPIKDLNMSIKLIAFFMKAK